MAKVTLAPAYVPQLLVSPKPRCFHRDESTIGRVCGELATWQRPAPHWFAIEYYCDRHHRIGDVAIAAEHVFRVVSLNVEILLCGVNVNAPTAQTEALARLKAAVEHIGGLVDVHDVGSRMVKSYVPGARAGDFASRDGVE